MPPPSRERAAKPPPALAIDRVVDRAVSYPYEAPDRSYLLDLRTEEVVHVAGTEIERLTIGRRAVLAVGSNAAPSQLVRKLADLKDSPTIPVVAINVSDHDVVYAALLSMYGAFPATLTTSPGTTVAVKATFLTDRQLDRMDETESKGVAYDVLELPSSFISAADSFTLHLFGSDPIPYYRATAGSLTLDGEPVALEAIQASRRRWRAMDEREMLTRLACVVGLSLDDLVRTVV